MRPERTSAPQHSLDSLIGCRVRVPTKTNPTRHWWVTVKEQRGGFIKVSGSAMAGGAWWTHIDKITRESKPASACGAAPTP